MGEFNPDEYLKKQAAGGGFNPDEYLNKYSSGDAATQPAEEQPTEYEMPGLGRRLYEQNVVIPTHALRHLAPFEETIQEYAIDPIAGAIEGETAEEHKKKRLEYDRYLRSMYPTASEAYESRGQAAGGLIKSALPVIGSTEGIIEQAATRPESLGLNVETGMNLLPSALSAPRTMAKGVGFIKARPDQRQSLRAYGERPSYYDEYEAKAGGKPVRALEEEVQNNLAAREASRNEKVNSLTGEVADLKSEDARQVKYAIDDIKNKTELGTYEGDAMISANKSLQDSYKKTAEIRNKVLDETFGEMDITPILKVIDNAERNVLLPEHKAAIRAVKDDVLEMSSPRTGSRIKYPTSNIDTNLPANNTPTMTERYDYQVISPRQLNVLREKLQKNVSWGGHTQAWETQYKDLARQFNDILDDSIPKNHELRGQIRAETLRYNKANDLFGGEYPLKKFQTAAKDPMMRRDLENLDIPEINDILKTVDYRANFEKNLKLGEKPKSEVIEEYLRKKAMLGEAKDEKLPLTSMQAPSALESAMMETYRNPKLNATNKIDQYAQQVHPEGPMDFMNKFEATKVLRDVEGINGAQGSRMVNLGRYVGGAAGAGMGAATGNPLWATAGGGAGAIVGGIMDNNASNIFRGGMRYGETMSPYIGASKVLSRATSQQQQSVDQSGIPLAKLAGTKYEAQMAKALQGDPKSAAVLHYVMSQNDPEYARLVSGGQQ
jgi:hypothetical protein